MKLKAAADAAEQAVRMEHQKMDALMKEKKEQKDALMAENKAKMEADRIAAVQKAYQDKQEQAKRDRAQKEATVKARIEAERAAAVQKAQQEKQEQVKRGKAMKEATMRAEIEMKEKIEAERAAAIQRAQQESEEQAKREKARQETLRIEKEALKRRKETAHRRKLLDKDRIGEEVHIDVIGKVIEDAAKEAALVQMMKQKKVINFIRRKTKPWLSRSRHTIEKRNASIAQRSETLLWSKKIHNNNPYSGFKIENLYKTRQVRTPEMVKERAAWALDSEESAKQFNVYKNEQELHANVWKEESFNDFAHLSIKRNIYQPQIKGKHTYTHLISCDPTATNSIDWFSHKFGLDKDFKKSTAPFDEIDITTKLVNSTDQLFPKLCNEVEAITFVLPEKKSDNERHDDEFWKTQRERLANLIEALSKDRFDFQCPILITYYSDEMSDVQTTFNNIPDLLGFKEQKEITDYHLLLMRKESITTRICDEMFWLFEASMECCD